MERNLPEDPSTSSGVGVLLESHRAFLCYLERRVGERALAEDILQEAFTRVLARPDQLPPDQQTGLTAGGGGSSRG